MFICVIYLSAETEVCGIYNRLVEEPFIDSCIIFELRVLLSCAEGEWESILILFLSELIRNSASRSLQVFFSYGLFLSRDKEELALQVFPCCSGTQAPVNRLHQLPQTSPRNHQLCFIALKHAQHCPPASATRAFVKAPWFALGLKSFLSPAVTHGTQPGLPEPVRPIKHTATLPVWGSRCCSVSSCASSLILHLQVVFFSLIILLSKVSSHAHFGNSFA